MDPTRTIHNPCTGETFTFVDTSRGPDEPLNIDIQVEPGGFVSSAHRHPLQSERFVVHEGVVRLELNGVVRNYGAGEGATIPAGVPHAWWVVSDTPLRATLTFTPGLTTEQFFRDYFGLARAGRTNLQGVPKPFALAKLLTDHPIIYHPRVPVWLQRFVFTLLVGIAKLLTGTWFRSNEQA